MGAEHAVHPEEIHGLGGLLAAARAGGQHGAAAGPATNCRQLRVRLPERRMHEELAGLEIGAAKTQRSCGHRAASRAPSAKKNSQQATKLSEAPRPEATGSRSPQRLGRAKMPAAQGQGIPQPPGPMGALAATGKDEPRGGENTERLGRLEHTAPPAATCGFGRKRRLGPFTLVPRPRSRSV